MKKNFYKVLGVSQRADPEKIKKAYRRAAKRYHPDISPKDEDKFKEVQEAYEALSDPEKRAIYDRENFENPVPVRPYYPRTLRSHSSSLLDEIDQFFATVEESWIDRQPDFFAEWQGSYRDLSVEIILTPFEAKEGCEIPLKIPFWADCRRCRGMGYIKGLICGFCRGRGREKIEKKMKITIPPGVKNGMQMRFPLMDSDLRRIDRVASLRVSR